MARELRDRYATMEDVLADLARAREGLSPFGPHGSAHPGPQRMRRAALAAVGMCLLAVLAFLAFGALPRRGDAPANPDAPPTTPPSAVLIEDRFKAE